ncbi:hypothetical protein TSAR_006993 [Trichomalopsis sarcophagae]|uniref:Uncharacterized protein n=1 Tax=Trichomalopsis sarcophagae TaxID=543379 RepID=A0A232F5Z5_9HYME|nr:hypothetical protein TSAR_006993 [Trichomalopsis sarcophagae]
MNFHTNFVSPSKKSAKHFKSTKGYEVCKNNHKKKQKIYENEGLGKHRGRINSSYCIEQMVGRKSTSHVSEEDGESSEPVLPKQGSSRRLTRPEPLSTAKMATRLPRRSLEISKKPRCQVGGILSGTLLRCPSDSEINILMPSNLTDLFTVGS